MSYDTKTQKKPELEKGAALSTVFFVEEPNENEKAPEAEENQPPSKSSANDAD